MQASTRRSLVLAGTTVVLIATSFSHAQSFPSKPIRLIVPFPPGGVDITIRLIQNQMSEDLGQPIVLENRGGANGFIGSELVAKAAPDGHTILATTSSTLIAGPLVSANTPFDPIKDFTPITMVYLTISALGAKASLPVNSVRELVDYAKKNPGKLSYGSSGIGSAQHLDGETFKLVAGTDIVHIPYKGGGPQAQGLVSGEIDVSFQPLQQLRPFMSGGKIKLLAFYNGPRPADLTNLPDLADAQSGFKAGPGFIGLLGPAKMPAPVLARLNSAAVKAITAPDTRAKLEANGAIIVAGTPESFAADLKSGLEGTRKYVEALKARGIKFE
ncbi:MAG: Bug family tripartite tricarboxylate transporter substrate binding protein [Burkholderiales bacterium]